MAGGFESPTLYFERLVMLNIRRTKNEGLVLGTQEDAPEVEITVVEIKEGHVRLGISLPREWSIHRKETWVAIQEEIKRNEEL